MLNIQNGGMLATLFDTFYQLSISFRKRVRRPAHVGAGTRVW
jgi:hypothetical protein